MTFFRNSAAYPERLHRCTYWGIAFAFRACIAETLFLESASYPTHAGIIVRACWNVLFPLRACPHDSLSFESAAYPTRAGIIVRACWNVLFPLRACISKTFYLETLLFCTVHIWRHCACVLERSICASCKLSTSMYIYSVFLCIALSS